MMLEDRAHPRFSSVGMVEADQQADGILLKSTGKHLGEGGTQMSACAH
jgi:hypothetical protein